MARSTVSRSLTNLRYKRTQASTRVKRLLYACLHGEAAYTGLDGLPSWWPFYTDSLYAAVRQLAHLGRQLQAEEACQHHAMVERKGDTVYAWQCADCGYVFGRDDHV